MEIRFQTQGGWEEFSQLRLWGEIFQGQITPDRPYAAIIYLMTPRVKLVGNKKIFTYM